MGQRAAMRSVAVIVYWSNIEHHGGDGTKFHVHVHVNQRKSTV